MNQLKVNEIFYSIQGEGNRSGEASIFIRLAGCNMNCYFCDTHWGDFHVKTLEQIKDHIAGYNCKWIVWTGGEPTLQLTQEIIQYFKDLGYKQAIETNGTRKVPEGLDYVVCSPKVSSIELKHTFKDGEVDEFRFLYEPHKTLIPSISKLPKARFYYISPMFSGKEKTEINRTAVEGCLRLIDRNPGWRLSLQIHKLINIK